MKRTFAIKGSNKVVFSENEIIRREYQFDKAF
jgi:hypothetical protein